MSDEKESEDWSEAMKAIGKVATAIKEKHKGEDWHGAVLCPICNGRLTVMHSGTNGHTHGRCETDDCLKWME